MSGEHSHGDGAHRHPDLEARLAALEGHGTHHVIDHHMLVENETMRLRSGDTVEFRNGARLMFGAGATADWQGTETDTWSGDGTVQNLDRDVKLFGHGDVMFMEGSQPSTLRFAEVDLQPTPELDHYPLHWHFAGEGSRGTLVEGVVVKNSTHRAFVPHASHGITFRHTIAKDIAGQAYWWNFPVDGSTVNDSNDILYDHALADGITNLPGDDRGYRLAAFDLVSGVGNTIRDSVARNIHPTHPKDCSGFKWSSSTRTSGNVWTFQNNRAYESDCHGIFVWENDSRQHLIEGYAGDQVSHGAYINQYDYQGIDTPRFEVHAVGVDVRGPGRIGEVFDSRHAKNGRVTFTDVQVGRFVVDSGWGSSLGVAHYVFTRTGLTCDSIEWRRPTPGQTVTIDGVECVPPS